MKSNTVTRLATLATVALFACSTAVGQDKAAPKPPPSDTTSAERMVRVYWEPSAQPPDIGNILSRVFSKEVAGARGRETLGVPPEVVMEVLGLQSAKVEPNCFSLSFRVSFNPNRPGIRPAAREFADELIGLLSEHLEEERMRQARPLIELAELEAHQAETDLDKVRSQISQVQDALREGSGRTDVSPEGILGAMTRLEDERQRLELDLAGMEARLDEVQRSYDRAQALAANDAKADPVLPELEKAVAIQEKLSAVARQQFEAGRISQKELADAEARLIDVKVQLLERRTNLAAIRSGAGSLSGLNQQLQELSIDIRDRRARLDYVANRLKPLRNASELIARYQNLESSHQSLQRVWEETQTQLRAAKRQARGLARDRVVVVEAVNQPAPLERTEEKRD
jgi:hypothetical protein